MVCLFTQEVFYVRNSQGFQNTDTKLLSDFILSENMNNKFPATANVATENFLFLNKR